MTISVLIPAFNAARTIEATINGVLQQTVAPKEVIVLDDGSTDQTAEIVRRFAPRVKLISTENCGAAAARNTLTSFASGELLAFLDADDLWHPQHLEKHCQLAQEYPQAVAYFSGHLNFEGYQEYRWQDPVASEATAELIPALAFFRQYHRSPGPFSSMSFCTVPQSTFRLFQEEPFQANGAEDYFFFTRVSLLGPVVYSPVPTVAYRFHPSSLSSNRLRVVGIAVQVYEMLEPQYKQFPERGYYKAFCSAFASKRRHYAKLLLGANDEASARDQLCLSLQNCLNPVSIAKSLTLLTLSYLPGRLRPHWPDRTRTMAGS